jgi:hypothetical protein
MSLSGLAALGVDQDITHDAEHGRDRLFRFGQSDEFDSDSEVPAHRGRRIPDLAFESDVHAAPISREVHGDQATGEFGRVGMIERDPDSEHGDIDDSTITPYPRGVARKAVRRSPTEWLTMDTAAILHDAPSVLPSSGVGVRPRGSRLP